jgi:hypothetical protein
MCRAHNNQQRKRRNRESRDQSYGRFRTRHLNPDSERLMLREMASEGTA